MSDHAKALTERVREARSSGQTLHVRAGGTKDFLGGAGLAGLPALDVTEHRGIVTYEPSELVVTVRCGTPLSELEQTLAGEGQQLPFEPPAFGAQATVGGVVSAGLSGPRRPYSGSVRDAVLGVRLLTGRAESLAFGGQVMKNVAGYDVSRLVAGSWGTLGVILEVSLKVMPVPERSVTLCREGITAVEALALFTRWATQPLPVTAACHLDGTVYVRLDGGPAALQAAGKAIGGDELPESEQFWRAVREHEHRFFSTDTPLWRLSLPPATAPLGLPGHWLTDWGGAQRWLTSNAPAGEIRSTVEAAGGHATLFRHAPDGVPRCHPLPPALSNLQVRVRQALDPDGVFNPGHPMGAC
ncbi:glycolate oxidase subunit GlcE [Thioalkalivibrio denitrificans]|uniref:Glycolate oxidase subunit GlcE n=1 Tax=Thioalkalivibrio denitrificans TaxID=108003 RepID=A0A1V3NKB3_9GAMM|nr:glycolate oxidase subunit GlcE [Thioalkalivibrio denitrificans]OOG25196.1 glycolate oxidase subunit GlcE [Thioalkalivibrio denitrificans]